MSRIGLTFAMAAAMLLACAGLVLAQSQEPGDEQATENEEFVEDISDLDAGDPIPGEYIVVLEEEVDNPSSVANDLSGDLDLDPTNVYDDALEGFAAEVPPGELSELRADPRVEAVVQDRVVEAAAQKLPTGVDRIDTDLSGTTAGDGTIAVDADIAIIDSGIAAHPDLDIAGGKDCSNDGKSTFSDDNGHGTHVAGTAAAKDNDTGVVGAAPGAHLWAVKVLNNNGDGSFGSVMCGVDWVTGRNTDNDTENDIDVANMSFGAPAWGSDNNKCGWRKDRATARLHQAICESVRTGVFYAAAAGNDKIKFDRDVPAAFNQVLAVTAMADFDGIPGGIFPATCRSDQDDTAANLSNFTSAGSRDAQHTIAAPGVCIESTSNSNTGELRTMSGTSMASPHVAGTAALCIANGDCSGMSPGKIREKLRSDAAVQPGSYGFLGDPDDPIGTRYYGYLAYAGDY